MLTGIRIDNSDTVKTMRYQTWDHFQYVQPRQEVSDQIVVVDITEEDLKKYGQWPWPRHTMAAFHATLTDAGAILVNYNILFADPDRMSGTEYLKSMPMDNELREQLGKILPDTDAIFSYVMKESNNAVLMMSVNHKESNVLPRTTPIIQKGDALPWLYNVRRHSTSTQKVAAGSTAIGVNVTSPEPDAVVRKMPMLIRVGDKVYPNMILENVRILNKSKRIKVISKQHGIDQILVKKDAGIPVNHNAEMYINYAEPMNYPHMTSDEVFTKHKDKLARQDSRGGTRCRWTECVEIHATWTDHRSNDNCTRTRHHNDWQVPVQTGTGRRIRNSVHGIFIIAVDTCTTEDQCVVGRSLINFHRRWCCLWCIRWHTPTRDS